MNLLILAFWISVSLLVYSYLVYPVVVWILARCCRNSFVDADVIDGPERGQSDEWPSVSLVISAYREETVILHRIQNALLLDYPGDRLEILIGCDGNEDLTADLVKTVDDDRVRLMQFPQRRGKASVLNDCIPAAKGEIVVLSDANTMMDRYALRRLVRHFRNRQVGGVCGKLNLSDSLTGQNVDGIYWRYENFIKRNEGRFGALLGVNGAIYAIRKQLYEPIPSNAIVDDFLIGMSIHRQGYQLLYDPDAAAYEETAPSIRAEFRRRARIGAGGFQSLKLLWPLLNPMRGRVALALWSHKLLRWMGPMLLLTALFSNALLAGRPLYFHLLTLQAAFYCVALGGLLLARGRGWRRVLRLPAMFVSMNAALAVGFFRWASGIRSGTWKPTERSSKELKRTSRQSLDLDHVLETVSETEEVTQ